MNPKSNVNPMEEFEKVLEEKRKELKRPVILVCGYTGTGKSSLIRAICGPEIVSKDKVVHGKPGTQTFDLYKNDFIKFFDSKGFERDKTDAEYIEKTKDFIRGKKEDSNPDNHIHLVWYTIQGSGARVTDSDLKLIKEILPQASNVIVVITKKDATKPIELNGVIERLKEGGVNPSNILPVFTIEESIYGSKITEEQRAESEEALSKLVTLTHELLPDAYKEAFFNAQRVKLKEKDGKAQAIIHSAAVNAAAAGAVPIPFSDAALIAPIQIAMIASLAFLYGIPKKAAMGVLGITVTTAVRILTASSLTKLIPVIGSIIQAGVAFGLTEALGQIVKKYLVSCVTAKMKGQPMPDFQFDPGDFAEAVKKAKASYKPAS